MEMEQVFRALGDANRLKIVRMLAGGEKCACRLLEEFQITQPTLSHHMKQLCECGLVSARREGRWTHYRLNQTMVAALAAFAAGLEHKEE